MYAFIKKIDEVIDTNEGVNWGITLKGNPKVIGYIGFWNMQKEHFRCETGYVLHPEFHRKGIMNEAMEAALAYCFNTMNFHSIEANVNPENDGSIHLLEKNNFVREGYYHENYFYNGRFLDTAIYSLLNPVNK